ncbi:MAG: hypothetical protein LQ344_005477 [Seirophora lacunosa]|nr:MAG: hypothetical protein LQ344_005477 [Seirophora lacunosa]
MSFSSTLRQLPKGLASLIPAALIASNTVLGGSLSTCENPQLSCRNTTAVADTCCFNAPGGQLLLTQFWDTNPPTGPNNSWTIHGLWPDRCDGTYEQYCDPSREYDNVTAIIAAAGKTDLLSYMNTYWKDYKGDDEDFWEHEWDKHGTCISTLEPSCYTNYTPQEEVVAYFQKTVDLFKTLDSYAFLAAAKILPSTTVTYSAKKIQEALSKPRNVNVTIQCRNGELDEIWYFYNVRGSLQTGEFVPSDPDGSKSNCPAEGIKYLPKLPRTSTPPAPTTLSTATGAPPSPTATSTPGVPFSGRGTLPVTSGGRTNGCIISGGTWYTTGTCAGFTATPSGSGFTLTSSKGKCAVANDILTCAATVTDAAVFGVVDGKLAYNGQTSFYTEAVPTGTVQAPVAVAERATTLEVGWRAL